MPRTAPRWRRAAVVRQVPDHVGVLSRGRLVETGPVADVFDHATDPYTAELLSAIPGRRRTAVGV